MHWNSDQIGKRIPQALLASIFITWSMLLAAPATAAMPCPADNVEMCTRYQTLSGGIDSGDMPTQLSSLRSANQELDPAFRALIYDKALKSPDQRLQTAALRYILASRTTYNLVLVPPAHLTPGQEKIYKIYSTARLWDLRIDERSDTISAVVISSRATGSMIHGGFELGWPYCRLRLLAGDEDAVKGNLRCDYPNGEALDLKASIELP